MKGSRVSTTRDRISVALVSLCVAITNGILLYVIGVRDRETTLNTWTGLKASGSNSFEPLTVWGNPTYVQWQGLGNRLPLFGNSVNVFTFFLSKFMDLSHLRLVLIVTMTFIGTHAFFCFISEKLQSFSIRTVIMMFCLASPFIAVSMRHTVANDWSENSLSFWALVGIFSSLGTILSSTRSGTLLPSYLVPTLAASFSFVSFGHPITGLLLLPLACLGTFLIAVSRQVQLPTTQRTVLVMVLMTFVASVGITIFDLWSEMSLQTQFLMLARESRYAELRITRQIVDFVLSQSGVVRSSELGFVGVTVWLLLIRSKKRPTKSLMFAAFIVNTAVVIDSEFSRLPILSSILSGEPYMFSEWVLIGNLLLVGRESFNHIANGEEFMDGSAVRRALQITALAPLAALPISLAHISLTSNIPKWNDSGSDALTFLDGQSRLKNDQFFYASEFIHRGLSEDHEMSLGPREVQAAGLVSLNNYSRVRSSQTLVTASALFENGIRANYCVDKWVAGFLQLDAIIGERFCDEGWESTKLVEENRRKFWIQDVHQYTDVRNSPCPLLETNCRELWSKSASFVQRELTAHEYLLRCKKSCVARWQIRGGYSNVLLPLNFDSGFKVNDQFGQKIETSNFHGLLLVEKSPSSSEFVTGTIRFQADLRAHLRAIANLFVIATAIVSIVLAIQHSLVTRRVGRL